MKNKLIYTFAALLLIGAGVGYHFYTKIFGKAIIKNTEIFIPTNSSLKEVTNILEPFINNSNNFTWVAKQKKYTKPKAGKYILKEGMNTNELVNLLRSGNQTAVKVSFNNQDSLEKLAGRIAQQLETDSISLLKAMSDITFLKKQNLDKRAALGMYIPNQYEFYWNISPEKFRNKMLTYYHNFWNKSRLQKAAALNLTKNQVTTLASIVQKETAKVDERPIVAGLYLNRYKNGWALQADPTVIYALKEKNGQDFVVKRVLNKDLEIDSPYNTYKNVGLPPAPIGMPDISAIDAVLNPAKHNYFYMCASVDKIGFHEFANSLAQHNRNAAKYQRWINERGIKR